jgi:hypothetical protein
VGCVGDGRCVCKEKGGNETQEDGGLCVDATEALPAYDAPVLLRFVAVCLSVSLCMHMHTTTPRTGI